MKSLTAYEAVKILEILGHSGEVIYYKNEKIPLRKLMQLLDASKQARHVVVFKANGKKISLQKHVSNALKTQ